MPRPLQSPMSLILTAPLHLLMTLEAVASATTRLAAPRRLT